MLERLQQLPPGMEGLKATGTITKEDYERAFEPIIDEARREGRRLRFLGQRSPSAAVGRR